MLTGADDFAAPLTYGEVGLSSDAARQAATAWTRRAWGLAMALADEGHFSWEDLRQAMLTEQASFDVQSGFQCRRWLRALSHVVHRAGLVDVGELAELSRWADSLVALEHA